MKEKPIQEAIRIERLMKKTFKASLGAAWGVGFSESEARRACEKMIVDFMTNAMTVRTEIRDGYLIMSQHESSVSGWYTIKRIADLKDGDQIFPQCMMNPDHLKTAIESHLAQYKEDSK